MDKRAAVFRAAMVDRLREAGISDARVLDVMGRVPRHRFVDRFHAPAPAPASPAAPPAWPPEFREWTMGDDADDATLEAAYQLDAALITLGDVQRHAARSSVSAPRLVASMLAELALEPGMRVLEIGAGSGYNAVLLAELVGDPALVTTVDIDAALVARTRRRLTQMDYDDVHVVAADGDDGVEQRAPFDRVVATVGCVDISPAWAAQLADGGSMLIPLLHGSSHPRILVSVEDVTIAGTLVGASFFVPVQGRQDVPSPWPPSAPPLQAGPGVEGLALPDWLEDLLRAGPGRERIGPPRAFALGVYITMRDPRANGPIGLRAPDGSAASITFGQNKMLTCGALGGPLSDELIAMTEEWVELGMPGLDRFHSTFTPAPDIAPAPMRAGSVRGPWTIPRHYHQQTVTLADGVPHDP